MHSNVLHFGLKPVKPPRAKVALGYNPDADWVCYSNRGRFIFLPGEIAAEFDLFLSYRGVGLHRIFGVEEIDTMRNRVALFGLGAGIMFADDMRRAIMAAPRTALDEFARANWRAFAAGKIDETSAQQLAELIETRKIIPPKPAEPRRRIGSRPRSPASMHRRRRWAASSWLPPRLAERFTQAEQGALGVIMAESLTQKPTIARVAECRTGWQRA